MAVVCHELGSTRNPPGNIHGVSGAPTDHCDGANTPFSSRIDTIYRIEHRRKMRDDKCKTPHGLRDRLNLVLTKGEDPVIDVIPRRAVATRGTAAGPRQPRLNTKG